jgi:Protein of unknown function (DUF3558)
MRTSVRSTVVLLAAVALTLSLTACGGAKSADKKADPATAATSDAAAKPTADTSTDAAATSGAAAGADSTKASTTDVCRLLANDTITSITGVDFSAAVAADDGEGTCSWDLTSTGGMATVSIIVNDNGGSSFEANQAVAKSVFDDVTDVKVAGVAHAFTYMGGLALAMDFGDKYAQVVFMSLGSEVVPDSAILKLGEEVAKNW